MGSKGSGRREVGLLAQEVETIIPEAVHHAVSNYNYDPSIVYFSTQQRCSNGDLLILNKVCSVACSIIIDCFTVGRVLMECVGAIQEPYQDS